MHHWQFGERYFLLPDKTKADIGAVYTLELGNGEKVSVTVMDTSLQNPIGFANSVGTLIISDDLYKRLLDSGL